MADNRFLIRVSADTGVDTRTIRKYLAGKPVRPSSRERIEYGLIDRGYRSYVRPAAIDSGPKSMA